VPRVFRAVPSIKLRPLEVATCIAISVAAFLGIILVVRITGLIHPSIYFNYAIGLAAATIGGVSTAFVWPTYLRVVPGRLDVLRAGILGRGVRAAERHDLRSSAVLVDLGLRCLFLAKDGVTTEIAFGALASPREFAHSVLLAAVSTHEPAPLPDDALVG